MKYVQYCVKANPSGHAEQGRGARLTSCLLCRPPPTHTLYCVYLGHSVFKVGPLVTPTLAQFVVWIRGDIHQKSEKINRLCLSFKAKFVPSADAFCPVVNHFQNLYSWCTAWSPTRCAVGERLGIWRLQNPRHRQPGPSTARCHFRMSPHPIPLSCLSLCFN